jgi:hypothetical protein
MNNNEVELLLVEDDPNDVELTLIALRKHKLANKIHVVRDGEEALDFLSLKLAEVASTEDAREGISAFIEKRQPVFKGK